MKQLLVVINHNAFVYIKIRILKHVVNADSKRTWFSERITTLFMIFTNTTIFRFSVRLFTITNDVQ